jgi:UDP-glucuronate decarboxylase
MKRILITGGAGFIGSHLASKLLDGDNYVIVVDNLHTGTKQNIEHLISNPRFKFLYHDISEPLDIYVEEIYNLACPASPVQYKQKPIQTIKTNVYGAINVLNLAHRIGAKVLQASTSEVYGDPEVHPQPESYLGRVNPIGPRACYDEGKRVVEALFFDYWREYSVPIKIVRIFNTYGPKMSPNDGRVVSNFITQALNHKEITIHGDGLQTRSFCYVDDLVDGLIRMMGAPEEVTGPINLGNPEECSILHLAHLVIEKTQSNSWLIFSERTQDDPHKRKPDISLASEKLNWAPKINLNDGIQKTIEYFR